MRGDRAVGLVCVFAAGFLAGQWSSGREALGPWSAWSAWSVTPRPPVFVPPCSPQVMPQSRQGVKRWIAYYKAAGERTLLK